MELVIDANIVISAIISMHGKTRDLIVINRTSFFAPEFLLEEIEKYKEEIITKSKLSEEQFELALSIIFSKIKLIPFSEFEKFIDKAKTICPDSDDIEYFAVALLKNIPIWSDDKRLKEQNKIKVYSTKEVLEII